MKLMFKCVVFMTDVASRVDTVGSDCNVLVVCLKPVNQWLKSGPKQGLVLHVLFIYLSTIHS